MMRETIGSNLKAKRSALGMSQKEVAQLSGLSERSYGKLERCQSNVTLDTLEAIMQGLGLTWEDLGRS